MLVEPDAGMRRVIADSWRPSDFGRFKVNTDAALDLVNGKVG